MIKFDHHFIMFYKIDKIGQGKVKCPHTCNSREEICTHGIGEVYELCFLEVKVKVLEIMQRFVCYFHEYGICYFIANAVVSKPPCTSLLCRSQNLRNCWSNLQKLHNFGNTLQMWHVLNGYFLLYHGSLCIWVTSASREKRMSLSKTRKLRIRF